MLAHEPEKKIGTEAKIKEDGSILITIGGQVVDEIKSLQHEDQAFTKFTPTSVMRDAISYLVGKPEDVELPEFNFFNRHLKPEIMERQPQLYKEYI